MSANGRIVNGGLPTPPVSRRSSAQSILPPPSSSTSTESSPPPSPRSPRGTGDPLARPFEILDKSDEDLPIPVVAAVGEQSAGKSSLLSSLCRVRLWSQARTATFGPTHIHSRRKATFSAKVYIHFHEPAPGVRRRVAFTEAPLSSNVELYKILMSAGEEARWSRDGSTPITTWEEMQERRSAPDRPTNNRLFTKNVVLLEISGPEQPNLSIIDLPGIVSGEGEVLSKSINQHYLAKPQTLIVLCLAGGGGDPTMSKAEIALVRQCDPTGTRVIGIVNKADKVDLDSGWTDLLVGKNASFDYNPAHGWHAVRCRTPAEFARAVSDDELDAVAEELFAQEGWTEVAREARRTYGWNATRKVIDTAYAKLVRDNVPNLVARVDAGIAAAQKELAALPPPVEDAVRELHCGLIDRIADLIMEDLHGDKGPRLSTLQGDLRNVLQASIPEFVPFLEEDAGRAKDYTSVALAGWPRPELWPAGEPNRVYLDHIYEALKPYYNPRVANFTRPPAAFNFTLKFVPEWEKHCATYAERTWAALDIIVEDVVRQVAADKPQALARSLSLLRRLQEPHKTHCTTSIATAISQERIPLEHIGTPWDDEEFAAFRAAQAHYRAEFDKLYRPNHDGIHVSPHYILPADDVPVQEWPDQFTGLCLGTAARASIGLMAAIRRLHDHVGRLVQCAVMSYVGEVRYALMEGFGLLALEGGAVKRARELCEPVFDIVQRRKEASKRRKVYEHLEAILEDQT